MNWLKELWERFRCWMNGELSPRERDPDLLRKVATHIRENPDMFNQKHWGRIQKETAFDPPELEISEDNPGCVAGHLVLLQNKGAMIHGEELWIHRYGAMLLGIEKDEADLLFNPTWPVSWMEMVEEPLLLTYRGKFRQPTEEEAALVMTRLANHGFVRREET